MRLSIVIPNYNYGQYVGAAIESALAVDWPDVEIIVVDDGSTDHSRDVIRRFGDKITAIFQANSTQLVACNVGFARSTGDAILFLDSDDMLAPSIARELAQVWRPGLSKVQCQMMRIDAQGEPKNSVFPPFNPMPDPEKIRAWAAQTTAYPTPPGSGNVYSRSFLEKIFPLDNSCGTFSDSACLAAAPFLGDVETLAKPLVFYRVHGKNDSNLLGDEMRFARELHRAQARFNFSRKLCPDGPAMADSLLLKSLPVLQFRIASLKLRPDAHPLLGDNLLRTLLDSFRVPWGFPAATRKVRFVVFIWCILTLLAPTPFARRLIAYRYKSGSAA